MFDKLIKFVKDLYYTQQRKPDEPEITYQDDNILERCHLVFPDGNKLQLHREKQINPFSRDVFYTWYISSTGDKVRVYNIPSFSTWQPPMVELWLLMLKDRKNWVVDDAKLAWRFYQHPLGFELSEKLYAEFCGEKLYGRKEWKIKGIEITQDELNEVMDSFDLYKYTNKMLRLRNIIRKRNTRIENEKRANDAKRIREYLNANK